LGEVFCNQAQRRIKIALDEIVLETNEAYADGFDQVLSFCVSLRLSAVHRAVDFDYEPFRGAVEVHDKRTDRLLPAELPTDQLSIAKRFPQELLTTRTFSSQISRSLHHPPAHFGRDDDPLALIGPIHHYYANLSAQSPPLHEDGEGVGG
jgi:hypothetical protein